MATDYKTIYSRNKNLDTMDKGSYNDWGDLTPARQVLAKQASGEVFDVFFTAKGDSLNIYGESLSVGGLLTNTIINYTVGVGKEILVTNVGVSGCNRGEYTVELNSNVQAKKRTSLTKFNEDFNLNGLKLVAGDVLKVNVTNKVNNISDFNANMTGTIYDA